ncbi:MAG: hypothetical protein WC797_01495 [Candidatus Paceibacterota bacterium]
MPRQGFVESVSMAVFQVPFLLAIAFLSSLKRPTSNNPIGVVIDLVSAFLVFLFASVTGPFMLLADLLTPREVLATKEALTETKEVCDSFVEAFLLDFDWNSHDLICGEIVLDTSTLSPIVKDEVLAKKALEHFFFNDKRPALSIRRAFACNLKLKIAEGFNGDGFILFPTPRGDGRVCIVREGEDYFLRWH